MRSSRGRGFAGNCCRGDGGGGLGLILGGGRAAHNCTGGRLLCCRYVVNLRGLIDLPFWLKICRGGGAPQRALRRADLFFSPDYSTNICFLCCCMLS